MAFSTAESPPPLVDAVYVLASGLAGSSADDGDRAAGEQAALAAVERLREAPPDLHWSRGLLIGLRSGSHAVVEATVKAVLDRLERSREASVRDALMSAILDACFLNLSGRPRLARSDDPENRLRAWGLSRELSGDIITEQNIHTLDVASWIMGRPPLSAYGTGGRKFRDVGTCWDTFSVVFQYADGVGITFTSRQFNGHGTRPEGIRNRMFGSEGVLETEYGGQVLIRGKQFYRGGQTPTIYQHGAVRNIATFYDSIQQADYTNATVGESVRSNLVTILGRTAAYTGRLVTWDEVLRSGERLVADLKGLKD